MPVPKKKQPAKPTPILHNVLPIPRAVCTIRLDGHADKALDAISLRFIKAMRRFG